MTPGDPEDIALADFIRREFLAPARSGGSAVFTICDFPNSEMMRDEDVPNFADWLEENGSRIAPGDEAEKAVAEMQSFCDDWLRATAHLRSD